MLTWPIWFASLGIDAQDHAQLFQYDAYPFLLRAIQEGDGVALGWRFMVDRMVEDGSLVKVGPNAVNSEAACYLQYRMKGPHSDTILAIVDWFQSTVEEQKHSLDRAVKYSAYTCKNGTMGTIGFELIEASEMRSFP